MYCIKAPKMYTGRGFLQDVCLVFDNQGFIAEISQEVTESIPEEYPFLTPAFIDPHCHIGMVRSGEPASEAESNEKQESFLVLPDALDSLQMDDFALQEAVEAGVLYSCILPGSGNILGGRSAVIRNYAADSNLALISRAGLKAAFGYNPMSTVNWQGNRPSTRMGVVAILRSKLSEVYHKNQRYLEADRDKKQEIVFSAEEKALQEVLQGRDILRVHVHKIDDIAALLRIVEEFKIRVTVEHALGVDAQHIFQELRQRNIPVIYGPLDAFAYKVELKKESWRNLKYLLNSGVDFGLMSDHPVTPSAQLFLQARWFLRSGYSKQQAVELLTRTNASLLGIEDRLGTLEKDKWASFICWNGDPFDLESYPVAVYGEGRLLHRETHKQQS